MTEQSYRWAGVDRDAAEDAKDRVRAVATRTHGPQVLGDMGGFGAMYELSGYRQPVLVSSTDGVGTKTKIAVALKRYEGLGEDVVNACVNDVIVSGAEPLYFLDYIAMGKLDPNVAEAVAQGMARACEASECALIGGETAEMPGMYSEEDFDLAGFAVGVVEKDDVLDGSSVGAGDVIIGIPSNGLHTNGFSLVRQVLELDRDTSPLMEHHPELGTTLGEALLMPHPAYYPTVKAVEGRVKSIAHITGGGLPGNVPRALPEGLGARLDTASWPLPPIFSILQERSDVARDEMYEVFNMGLGLVLVCDPSEADQVTSLAPNALIVGEIVSAEGDQRVIL